MTIVSDEEVAALLESPGGWGRNGDSMKHRRYSLPSSTRRRCGCCKKRATHVGCCNGVALMSGCEKRVQGWIVEGTHG
jgi:hypothetical protein